METFCWDFVSLSKASPPADASSSVCKRQSIPVYCLTMPRIYVYTCQDLHILLFSWLWRLHLTKILVVNVCCQKIEHCLHGADSRCSVSLCVLLCLVDPWLGGLSSQETCCRTSERWLAEGICLMRICEHTCEEGNFKVESAGQKCWNSNITSKENVPRYEPLVFSVSNSCCLQCK